MKLNKSEKKAILELKSVILPKKNGIKISFIIITVICAAILAFLASRFDPMTERTAKRYDGENTNYREYVYADIKELGKPFYDKLHRQYYLAKDTEGNDCLLMTDGSDELSDVPGRLYGTTDILYDFDIERLGLPLTEYEEIPYIEVGYRNLFDKNIHMLIFGFPVLFLWYSFYTKGYRRLYGSARRNLKTLRKRGLLEQAAAELNAPGRYDFPDGNGFATEHFVFTQGLGTVLCYEDIVRVYTEVFKNGGKTMWGMVNADTKKRRGIYISALRPENMEQHAREIMTVIQRNAPSVEIGAIKIAVGRLPGRKRK